MNYFQYTELFSVLNTLWSQGGYYTEGASCSSSSSGVVVDIATILSYLVSIRSRNRRTKVTATVPRISTITPMTTSAVDTLTTRFSAAEIIAITSPESSTMDSK